MRSARARRLAAAPVSSHARAHRPPRRAICRDSVQVVATYDRSVRRWGARALPRAPALPRAQATPITHARRSARPPARARARSPSVEIPLPSVIVLKRYSAINAGKEASLTRRNLFLRDGFQCQYCGDCLPAAKLTYDHVHPRSLGGKTSWTNTVTACGPCNNKKGSKLLRELPSMKLRHEPRAPQWHALQAGSKAYPPKKMHPSWHDYFF